MSEVIPKKTYPSIRKSVRTRIRSDGWISRTDAILLLRKRARRESQQGDATAAIEIFDLLIAYEPKNAANFANRGLMNQHLKQHRQALRDYDQAIALNPRLDRVYSNRANLHAAERNWLEAIDDYDRAIELNPLNIRARLNQAITLRQMGHYEEALTSLDIALFFRPESATLYAEHGRTYQLQGKRWQAIASYNIARQLIQRSTAPDLCNHERVGCRILHWMINV